MSMAEIIKSNISRLEAFVIVCPQERDWKSPSGGWHTSFFWKHADLSFFQTCWLVFFKDADMPFFSTCWHALAEQNIWASQLEIRWLLLFLSSAWLTDEPITNQPPVSVFWHQITENGFVFWNFVDPEIQNSKRRKIAQVGASSLV